MLGFSVYCVTYFDGVQRGPIKRSEYLTGCDLLNWIESSATDFCGIEIDYSHSNEIVWALMMSVNKDVVWYRYDDDVDWYAREIGYGSNDKVVRMVFSDGSIEDMKLINTIPYELAMTILKEQLLNNRRSDLVDWGGKLN